MLKFLLSRFYRLRIVRALRTYRELEQFAARHRKPEDSPTESLLFFYQRKAYKAGQEDGEEHVMSHAYYWSGGQDENWEPNMKQLYLRLSRQSCILQRRGRLLSLALKRAIQLGEEVAQLKRRT